MRNSTFVLLGLFFLSFTSTQGQSVELIQKRDQTYNFKLHVDGKDRRFLVHVPSSYIGETEKNYPVVFMLHGGGGSGKKYYNISQWKEVGEREGIITVFPTAQEVCFEDQLTGEKQKDRYWLNTRKAAALCPGQKPHDDVAFIRLIAGHLKKEFRVDAKRFYCTGFSNGMGFTMSRVLPELSDLFAAVGGTGSMLDKAVPVANPIPCWMMVGERDPKLIQHNNNQSFPTTIAGFEQSDFLTGIIGQMLDAMQINQSFEAKERKKHTTFHFTQTQNGGKQELRFSILKGQKHSYPRGIAEHNNIVVADIFWDFFQQYTK